MGGGGWYVGLQTEPWKAILILVFKQLLYTATSRESFKVTGSCISLTKKDSAVPLLQYEYIHKIHDCLQYCSKCRPVEINNPDWMKVFKYSQKKSKSVRIFISISIYSFDLLCLKGYSASIYTIEKFL